MCAALFFTGLIEAMPKVHGQVASVPAGRLSLTGTVITPRRVEWPLRLSASDVIAAGRRWSAPGPAAGARTGWPRRRLRVPTSTWPPSGDDLVVSSVDSSTKEDTRKLTLATVS